MPLGRDIVIALQDCATGKIHEVKVLDPNAIPSPQNKGVFLMFEERYGNGGNLLRGYWRDPRTDRLYKEVAPRAVP